MKKTVIDELIETFEEMLAYGGDSDLHAAIEHCKNKKEKHKQEIIEAYIKAQDNVVRFYDVSEAEEYYKETYLNE